MFLLLWVKCSVVLLLLCCCAVLLCCVAALSCLYCVAVLAFFLRTDLFWFRLCPVTHGSLVCRVFLCCDSSLNYMKEVLSCSKMSTLGWPELREAPHWLQQRHHQVSYCILLLWEGNSRTDSCSLQIITPRNEGGTSVYHTDYVKGRHIGEVVAHSLDITQ